MTRKELQNRSGKLIRVNYCDLQYLTKCYNAYEIGCNSGVYGWNWTAYALRHTDGRTVNICTGYRSLIGDNVKGLTKFNDQAKKISDSWGLSYDQRKKRYQKIIDKMIDYVYNA